MAKKLVRWLIGEPRNPLHPDTRQHIALIAFLAWIGLGADGLSSSCYGPEEAFIALGPHSHLALYLAPVMAITVFIISLAYNQVIELFPNGGGGYQAATHLLGPKFGLIAGIALMVDYILTIAISLSSGMDAIFSFLPPSFLNYKLATIVIAVILLTLLNLRGMKESVQVLLPIFLGFFITHVALIFYGILTHSDQLPTMITTITHQSREHLQTVGWVTITALFLRAYSLGGSTYTGLEAVSNNVNMLAKPRVRTGKWTMLYMAISLSFIAGGILLLYLLWQVQPVSGKTLNAMVFGKILAQWPYHHTWLVIILLFEAGLLCIGANTGFMGGPAVLANMALDNWLPRRFCNLSSRLVKQNGVLLFGIGALITILWSEGRVGLLVVLYSMNVFLAFSLTLLGLCVYWCRNRKGQNWIYRLTLSTLASIICLSIFLLTLLNKFDNGGWVTVLIILTLVFLCYAIKHHYKQISQKLNKLDKQLTFAISNQTVSAPQLDPNKPTAAFIIDRVSLGMHALLWVQRMFPNHFKNFIFISPATVDVGSYGSEAKLKKLQSDMKHRADYFSSFSKSRGIAAKSYSTIGTDTAARLSKLCQEVAEDFPNTIFFASKLIFSQRDWISRLLHDDTLMIVERRLHLKGLKLLILPMKI